MRCPTCIAEGATSRVYVGAGSMTLLGYSSFYDELGKWHLHDPNTSMTDFKCDRGHAWAERSGPSRCWCGWPEQVEVVS